MDFYQIRTKEGKTKADGVTVTPKLKSGRTTDLMIRGGSFYAIWDDAAGMWTTDILDAYRLVDADVRAQAIKYEKETGVKHIPVLFEDYSSGMVSMFLRFIKESQDNSHQLDSSLTFANTEVKKTDYVSRRLPYALGEADIPAWHELIGTLYSVEERAKIEWAIGSIVAGDSKKIQKFLVFYGPHGTGKSTILNIVQKLFQGYTTAFDGKALGSNNGAFATEPFKDNPLVAIQHDGDLSKLEDNTRLNSIISHEDMTMNEKYKASYTNRVNAMLFVGSNQPVKISDAKSGIIRRLIDVNPTGAKLPPNHYDTIMGQIDFELGGIAHYCREVYLSMGKNYYNTYRPTEMMFQTDIFFNFVEAYYDVFKAQQYTTLDQAYKLYKEFCEESGITYPQPKYKLREDLRDYFDTFQDRGEIDGQRYRSIYSGFNAEKFKAPVEDAKAFSLVVEETTSLLDESLAGQAAQLANKAGLLSKKWAQVKTTLEDIDTTQLHWVRVPENHIVIDFDLKGDDGIKSLEQNLEAASAWPPTYAEISKSGQGVHLHYSYLGDAALLRAGFSEGIEVKVYAGDSSLRRRLSHCNAVPVSEISSGLPLKEKKEKMLNAKTLSSERTMRDLIKRNLRKEIHPGTKPSIDFIKKILDDAYESDMQYDVTDLRSPLMSFANNSSNQAGICLKTVQQMKFVSKDEVNAEIVPTDDDRIVFFDVEVYQNLFVICWKYRGSDQVVTMINPKPAEVEALFKMKLVGFYCRRYDNHIIYAASMGHSNKALFALSQKMIVDSSKTAPFGAAYNISYADIWDFSSKKQGLKKFEIELGITHMELDIPWDQPVDEKDWPRVTEYCANDVRATEAVFESRKEDFVARQILAELSGLTVNDTTQKHTARIIFGMDKNPQSKFVYTDLSEEFPGYTFELGKSDYRGEDPGEGGYVYAEPGSYANVALLDIASMHPTSMVHLGVFGPYTERFEDLLRARMAIKRSEFAEARVLLEGRLEQFLVGAESDPSSAKALAYALKIVINIVYGLTSAKFDNPFKDNRNVDNIVAKRGALFMIDLKHIVQEAGYVVAHIKTDSIKIPNADEKIIKIVTEYGKAFGYDFEHEATYPRFCLVNDAVYVAAKPNEWDDLGKPFPGFEWEAVGAQFQHPYVFKELFSFGEVVLGDLKESRSVLKGAMYLDFDGQEEPKDHSKMRHVGKTGQFVPVLKGGGALYRVNDDKYYAVTGTKGHLWMEAHVAEELDDLEVDMSYFEKLKETAIKAIEQYEPLDSFLNPVKE